VAREVGSEGKLGGQAQVKGVAGVWKDLTDNVNFMASNLTIQLRDVSKVATAIADGDLTQQFPVSWPAEPVVARAYVDQLRRSDGGVAEATLDEISGALDLVAARLASSGNDPALAARVDSLALRLAAPGGDAVTLRRTSGLADTLRGLAARVR
jgi:HAMP domain-containing protein